MFNAQWWGRCEYAHALERMQTLQDDVAVQSCPGTIAYVEHPPVITYGRNTPMEEIFAATHKIPTHEVPRGGYATWHGPGQLVGYPIIRLRGRMIEPQTDLRAFLRTIEGALIRCLREHFALETHRIDGMTGVWIHDTKAAPTCPLRKIASIGISVRRFTTAHGFALNIANNPAAFGAIVPCGLHNIEMTSVAQELQRRGAACAATPELVWQPLHTTLSQHFVEAGWRP